MLIKQRIAHHERCFLPSLCTEAFSKEFRVTEARNTNFCHNYTKDDLQASIAFQYEFNATVQKREMYKVIFLKTKDKELRMDDTGDVFEYIGRLSILFLLYHL